MLLFFVYPNIYFRTFYIMSLLYHWRSARSAEKLAAENGEKNRDALFQQRGRAENTEKQRGGRKDSDDDETQ